jgi:hypothetical protein
MTDQTPPKRQLRQRLRPEGYISFTGLCLMLGIDGGQGRELIRQKRLPEPIKVQVGSRHFLFFSLDLVRGKMGAQTSLTKQRKLRIPTRQVHHTLDWVRRRADR